MEINILLIIVAVLLLINIVDGYKKGAVRAIISFVSLVVLCVIVALIGNGVKSYFDGEFMNAVIMVLLLVVLSIGHHLLGLILFPAKLVSKLPIVHSVDKLLGIVVGILATVLILWTIYTFTMMMDMGAIGQLIIEHTQNNSILTWFYEHNYLAHWLQKLGTQFRIL